MLNRQSGYLRWIGLTFVMLFMSAGCAPGGPLDEGPTLAENRTHIETNVHVFQTRYADVADGLAEQTDHVIAVQLELQNGTEAGEVRLLISDAIFEQLPSTEIIVTLSEEQLELVNNLTESGELIVVLSELMNLELSNVDAIGSASVRIGSPAEGSSPILAATGGGQFPIRFELEEEEDEVIEVTFCYDEAGDPVPCPKGCMMVSGAGSSSFPLLLLSLTIIILNRRRQYQ